MTTQLRDARLKRALDAADDEPSRPQPRTRDTVREAARRAVASKAVPWWRSLWPAGRGARMPWNAAFATVLLAVLVGVLWQDKEVPGVRSDPPMADAPAPAATPSPAASPEATASVAAPPGEAGPAASPGPAAASSAAPASARAAPRVRERLSRDEASEQRLLQRSLEEAAVAQARREGAPAEVTDPQGAASRSAPAAVAPAAPSPPASPAPQPASPAPQPAAPPPPAKAAPSTFSQAAPAGGAAARAPSPAAGRPPAAGDLAAAPGISWEGWTELRIAADGRELVLSRRRAPQLSELINRAARAAQSAAPAAQGQVPTASYELSTRGTLLAVLEVGETHARFLPVGESGPSHLVRLDPAELQALREETLKLLPPR